jgi:hypothetical protein
MGNNEKLQRLRKSSTNFGGYQLHRGMRDAEFLHKISQSLGTETTLHRFHSITMVLS